jgi:hypothetical protein
MKNKQFVQHDKNAFLLNECLIIKQLLLNNFINKKKTAEMC